MRLGQLALDLFKGAAKLLQGLLGDTDTARR